MASHVSKREGRNRMKCYGTEPCQAGRSNCTRSLYFYCIGETGRVVAGCGARPRGGGDRGRIEGRPRYRSKAASWFTGTELVLFLTDLLAVALAGQCFLYPLLLT